MTARTTLKTTAITLAALGAAIGTAIAPAAFATTADVVSVKIDTRYLETDWGVEMVYKTLANEAENACVKPAYREVAARRIERDCMTNLLNEFIESADIDKLTTYHAAVTN